MKPHIKVVTAEIECADGFLITQRRPEATMALLWEFPGGRVLDGESDHDALARKLQDNLGVAAVVGGKSMHIQHIYDGYTLDFVVYKVSIIGEPRAVKVHDFKWVQPEDFANYEFPSADQASVAALLEDELLEDVK